MRVVFLGTPKFAATVLKTLCASRHQVAAVVTQPDRPNKRGNKTEPSEVKKTAVTLGLPIYQFQKIRTEGAEVLKSLNADVLVTAAYGQILSEEILTLAPHGVLNVHASILPKYRGSSPVQRAILNGETNVGVTIMKTALKVDAGDVAKIKTVTLAGDESTEEVLELLAPVGAEALIETLDEIENGSVCYQKQDESQATHYPMLKKEDGKIDFSMDAAALKNFVRAMNPWPSAYCETDCGTLKIFRATVKDPDRIGNAGEIVAIDTKYGFEVQTGRGTLFILEVQPDGGKKMSAAAYLNGRKLFVGGMLR